MTFRSCISGLTLIGFDVGLTILTFTNKLVLYREIRLPQATFLGRGLVNPRGKGRMLNCFLSVSVQTRVIDPFSQIKQEYGKILDNADSENRIIFRPSQNVIMF